MEDGIEEVGRITREDGSEHSEGQDEDEEGSEEIDDETLARRLFLSEQLAHQRRLMAIAGKCGIWGTVRQPLSERTQEQPSAIS